MGEARHIIYGVRLVFAFRSVYCSLKEMFSKVFSHYDKNNDVFVLDVKGFLSQGSMNATYRILIDQFV